MNRIVSYKFLLIYFCCHTALYAQQDTIQYEVWELNLNLHRLHIPALGNKLQKKHTYIALTYADDLTNTTDFYRLGDDAFYLARQNAFKINRCRYSGKLLGYDNTADLRFIVEFRKGKLDGKYVVYKTNGLVETKVYQKGKLFADVVRSKLEKIRGN